MITRCEQAITYFAKKECARKRSAKDKNKKKEDNAPNCYEMILFKWPVLKEILSAFKVPYEITNAVQNATFTLADFYGSWLKMERELDGLMKEIAMCDFLQMLREKLELRRKSLLNNTALIAAVYLDPRYNFKLTGDEIKIAKITLRQLFERAKKLNESKSLTELASNEEDDSFENACVSAGMPKAFRVGKMQLANKTHLDVDLEKLFENFENCDRLHNKESILNYWEVRKDSDPILYELASIVLAIPPTQATVERAFRHSAAFVIRKHHRYPRRPSKTSL